MTGADFKLTAEGKNFLENLKSMSDKVVSIGFFDGKTYPDGTPIAQVAAKNEFGDSKTPSRPFMRQTIEANETLLNSFVKDIIDAVQKGTETAESGLGVLGEFAVECVQDTISNGKFVPNSAYTIATKGSNNPLIDTGTMKSSVEYRVKDRGK